MASEETTNPLAELDTLLDRERRALTDGNLDLLADLTASKEAAVARLSGYGRGDSDALDRLQDKMSRNRELLESALEGIRAVADRMAELRRVRRGLETYDRAGRRTRVDTGGRPTVERRA